MRTRRAFLYRERDADRVRMLFTKREAEFVRRLPAGIKALSAGGRLWLAWPKRASGAPSDLTQSTILSRGLATGLVDFKICAGDETWSGLCFTRRRK